MTLSPTRELSLPSKSGTQTDLVGRARKVIPGGTSNSGVLPRRHRKQWGQLRTAGTREPARETMLPAYARVGTSRARRYARGAQTRRCARADASCGSAAPVHDRW